MFHANELKLLKYLLRFVRILLLLLRQNGRYYIIFLNERARALPSRFRLFRHTLEYNAQAISPKLKTIFLSSGGGVRFDKLSAARHPARSIRAAANADTVAVIDTRGNDDDAVAAAAAAYKSRYIIFRA